MARFCVAIASIAVAADALSLLQTGLEKDSLEKDIPFNKIMKKESTVYKDSLSQVGSLQQQLSAVNAQNMAEAEEEKGVYDEQLQEIKHNVTAQERKNAAVVRDIKALDVEIAGLRATIDPLTEHSRVMREELLSIQSNIGLVQEFLTSSLEKTDQNVSMSADLQVITELENEDFVQKHALAHQKSLDMINKKTTTKKVLPKKLAKKIALLQTKFEKHDKKHVKAAEKEKGADAKGILTTLASHLQEMIEEQAAAQAAMKVAFEEEYSNHTAKLDKLAEDYISLNATRATKTDRIAKLKVAVSHLQKTSKSLTKRRESLVNFGNKLAARPDPMQLLQEKKAAAAATTHGGKNASLLETQPAKSTGSWLSKNLLR